jgi:hypothetical protein
MGAGQSIPSVLTREKVFELTRETRGVMDVLLEYMLKEVTVRDFLALSNPTECRKYVIFMANNLYRHFYELQIVPTKDKRGVIAFRPVKELVSPPEGASDAESERQSLCLTLAYFYTRIFQIYGALALTLIDDSKFMIESGIIPTYGDTTTKGLLPPGYRPYTTMGGGGQEGGDGRQKVLDLGNFYFLNTFLYDEKTERGYEARYAGEGDGRGVVYFTNQKLPRNETGRPTFLDATSELREQKGIFSIGYSGAKKYAYLEATAKSEGISSGKVRFVFGKLRYSKKDSAETLSLDIPSEIISQKTLAIVSSQPIAGARKVYSIQSAPDTTIVEYFTDVFQKLIPFIKRVSEGDVSAVYSTAATVATETGTQEELRLARIIQNLTKTKPLGHCLARAMQLLKTYPLKGEPGVSYICKAKFFEQTTMSSTGVRTVVSRSGIPEPGASLDTSPGLAALTQLFYDTVLIGTPKISIGERRRPDGSPSSMEQYITFMKTMARLFGDDAPRSDDMIKLSGLKGIKNKRDSEVCGPIKGDITVPRTRTASVYDVVNQLYRTQLEHSAKCGQIFKQLFNIQRDKTSGRFRISLSDNIIKKGFPEIERINYLARDTLIKYYTTCELKYLQGMKLVIDAKRESNAAARPAVPGLPGIIARPGGTPVPAPRAATAPARPAVAPPPAAPLRPGAGPIGARPVVV